MPGLVFCAVVVIKKITREKQSILCFPSYLLLPAFFPFHRCSFYLPWPPTAWMASGLQFWGQHILPALRRLIVPLFHLHEGYLHWIWVDSFGFFLLAPLKCLSIIFQPLLYLHISMYTSYDCSPVCNVSVFLWLLSRFPLNLWISALGLLWT